MRRGSEKLAPRASHAAGLPFWEILEMEVHRTSIRRPVGVREILEMEVHRTSIRRSVGVREILEMEGR
jgi:hypothetical protein